MVLTSGLLAYYKLDNVNDSSGSGFTLTNNGSVTFSTGKIDNCAIINSYAVTAVKYLSIANDLGVDGGSLTMAAWYKPSGQPATSGDHHTIVCHSGTTTDVNDMITYYNNSSTMTVWFNRQKQGTANQAVSYATTLSNGTWYHLVYTYDGSYVRAYINGSQVGSDVAASGSGSANQNDSFAIGAVQGNPAGTYYYTPNGIIDEVGVWNRALSGTEISELYNSGNGLTYPFTTSTADNALLFGGGL